MGNNPTCAICGQESETWWHCFFGCAWARRVWRWIGIPNPVPNHAMVAEANVADLYQLFKGWNHLQWAAFWNIWVERNARSIRNVHSEPYIVARKSLALSAAFESSYGKKLRTGDTRLVSWVPNGEAADNILHVDESSLGNPGRAGFGAVIRNGNGRWVEGISGYIGTAKILKAELHGILAGLKRLVSLHITSASCFTDSKEALRVINAVDGDSHHDWAIISNIRILLHTFPGFRFRHILREDNGVADALAKRGAKGVEFYTTWAFPPDVVRSIVFSDAAGVLYPRA